jgi:hypothetical protein
MLKRFPHTTSLLFAKVQTALTPIWSLITIELG